MLESLFEQFIPKEFPHREKQINSISKVFEDLNKFGFADNLILSGVTGSGKTAILRKIVLERKNSLYVSGKDYNSTRKLFLYLTQKRKQMSCELMLILIEQLKKNPKILIIDEVHLIRDIENLINCINEIYRQTGMPIIIATNQRGFVSKMPEDARFTLFFQRVDFPSYNALQLNDILESRLKLLTENLQQMPEDAKKYICAKVVHEYFGSARIVLDLVKKCYKNNNFSTEFINQIINQIEEETTENFILNLSGAEKRFLEILIELGQKQEEMTTADIKKEYPYMGIPRISQLITTFVKDYAILEEDYKNLGRKAGRYRVVKFISEKDSALFYEILHPEIQEVNIL